MCQFLGKKMIALVNNIWFQFEDGEKRIFEEIIKTYCYEWTW